MKKFNLIIGAFLIMLLSATNLNAQSTYDLSPLTAYDASIFGDITSASSSTGWTNIHAYNAGGTGNTWSAVQALPIPFDYFGSAVTHFIVSKNFLISFDTTLAGTVVDTSINDNSSLPYSGLANNTIAAWWGDFANGTGSLGTNDNVWMNVFGTAPNRKFYIKFFSYEGEGRSFSYPHVLFEETTNKIYITDSYMGSITPGLTVGLQENSASAVQTANSPNESTTITSSTWSALYYYEFSPRLLIPNDAGTVSIDAPTNPISLGNQNVSATIVNQGTSALATVTVNWEANGVLQTPVTTSPNIAANATASVSLGMYNFTGATDITVWTSMPNGSADANPSNDTTSMSFFPSLSGVYTINGTNPASNTNFQSFGKFSEALNLGGVSGPVTVNVAAATYNEHLYVGTIMGSSDTNRVTIDGANSATLTHDGSNQIATILLEGATYITIQNMTIGTTPASGDGHGFHLKDNASFVTIDNNIINVPLGTTADRTGINVSSDLTSDVGQGNNASNLTISNNTVTGGERGINMYGSFTASARNQNVTIHNNTVQNSDDAGLYLTGINNITITDNVITGLTNAGSDGIYVSDLENFNISGNSATGIDNGLDADDLNFDNTVTLMSTISNNMFIGGDDGMYLDDIEMINIFHNSFSAADYGIYINDQANLDIRNNIFYSSGGDVAFYYLDASTVGFTALDYNIYYTSGANIARSSSGNYADLTALQAGLAGDVNSLVGDPTFLGSTSDLHVGGALANDVGDNSTGITVDIDGDTRPLAPSTTVDIGADEFAPPACAFPGALAAINIYSDTVDLSWFENGTATSWQISYGPTGTAAGAGTTVVTSSNPYTVSGLTPSTGYVFYVRAICVPDTSSWSSGAAFATSILGPQGITCVTGNQSVVFSEEFDNNAAGWTGSIGSGGNQWEIPDGSGSSNTGADAAHSGSNYMNFEATSATLAGGAIVSPMIDLSAASGDAELSFWMHAYGAAMGDLNVGVGTSAAGPFTTVFTQLGQLQTAGSDPWQNVGVNLASYLGQTIYIELNMSNVAAYTSDMSIDLFEVTSCLSCTAPSLVGATAIATDTANVSWIENGSATQWEVEYGAQGFVLGAGNSMIVNVDTFATISGLTSSTAYDWYVRAICAQGDTSGWTIAGSFTTAFQCPAGAVCNTYTSGDIPTDDTFTSLPGASVCPTSVSLVVPAGNRIDSVTTTYDMTALGGAWMAEQVSYLYSPTTLMGEGALAAGTGNAAGTVNYSRSGLSFANGGTGTVAIEMHAGRTWTNTPGCNTANNKVDDGTWLVIAYYSAIPACVEPNTLSGAGTSTTDATISWVDANPSPAGNYQISYGTTGTAAGAGTLMSSATTSASISGLTVSTSYDFYVRTVCSASDTSGWSLVGNFSTLTGIPYNEDFETGFSGATFNGWVRSRSANPQWLAGSSTSSTATGPAADHTVGTGGTFMFLETSSSVQGVTDTLWSPAIIVGASQNTLLMNHWYHMYGADMGTMQVLIESNGTYDTLASYTGQQHIAQSDPWLPGLDTLIGYGGQTIQVIVVGVAGSGYNSDNAIDDISIIELVSDNIASAGILRLSSGCGNGSADSVEMVITNIGSAAQSNFPVGYSVNGVAITPETYTGTLAPGATANYTFNTTVNISALGAYDFKVYTALASDGDNSNDTSVISITTFSTINTFPYAESFENGAADWSVGGLTSFELGAPNNTIIDTASDGTQAWVTDLDTNYGASEAGWVISPCFDFTNVVDPFIELDVFYDIEGDWDGAVLQTTVDNGATWQNVGSVGDTVNWFNDPSIDALTASSISTSLEGWSSTLTGWETAKHYLDGLGGQSSVRIRVALASDGSVEQEGMAFDNVKIWDNPKPDPYYAIGTINTEDANGVADSNGVDCWTSGVTVGYNRRGGGNDYALVDMSSGSQEGITVFDFNIVSGYVFQEGDSLSIHGFVSQFNGLTQFRVDSIEVLASGVTLPTPTVATVMDESTESILISVTDNFVLLSTPATSGSFNVDVSNGTDTMTLRIDSDSDIEDSLAALITPLVAGDTICGMIGVGGQFTSSTPALDGYQLFPRSWADMTICRNTTGITNVDSKSNEVSIYPNPTNGLVTIVASGFESNNVQIEVLDISGRAIYTNVITNKFNKTEIDLSEFAKGVYFVSIVDGNSRKVEKLILR